MKIRCRRKKLPKYITDHIEVSSDESHEEDSFKEDSDIEDSNEDRNFEWVV